MNRHLTTHAAHVQTVLLYLLLVVVDYPNPDLAWRFFHGAPIVGSFVSAALRDRTRINGQFDDPTIKEVARDCFNSLTSEKKTLTPAAAEKAMEKVEDEFASGTLRGPFDTPEELRWAMQDYVRSFPGFEGYCLAGGPR